MTNYLELNGVDRKSPAALLAIGAFLKGKDKDLWIPYKLRGGSLNEFMKKLRNLCIKSSYEDHLFN